MNDSNFFSFHISDLRMLAKPIDNYDVLCGCVRESRRFKASVLRHQVFRYALLFRLSKINFTKGWNGAKTASLLFIPRTRGVLSLSVPFFFFACHETGNKTKLLKAENEFSDDSDGVWCLPNLVLPKKGGPLHSFQTIVRFFSPSFQRLAECERRESPRQWEKKIRNCLCWAACKPSSPYLNGLFLSSDRATMQRTAWFLLCFLSWNSKILAKNTSKKKKKPSNEKEQNIKHTSPSELKQQKTKTRALYYEASWNGTPIAGCACPSVYI